MRHTFWRISLGALWMFAICTRADNPANPSPPWLAVMTYNLRYASPTPPNAWPQRRPLMRELMQQVTPDVIGTQEGLYGQIKDLATDLPDYEWVGTGRDGGSRGEFMAVFFRRHASNRWRLITSGCLTPRRSLARPRGVIVIAAW